MIPFGTFALYGMFYNVSTIHVGTAITFSQIALLMIAVIAQLFLGERLSRSAWPQPNPVRTAS